LGQNICSILRERPELIAVGEVDDGLEAAQKANDLKPDLILLDIGLILNGVEAAKCIRQVAPDAAIIVVLTQNGGMEQMSSATRSEALFYPFLSIGEISTDIS
jgi:DNA-binding NarL/FixJ family response regulator